MKQNWLHFNYNKNTHIRNDTQFATTAKIIAVYVLLFALLFADSLLKLSFGMFDSAFKWLAEVFSDPANQRLAIVSFGFYVIVLLFFRWRLFGSYYRFANSYLWLAVCLLIVTTVCAFNHFVTIKVIVLLVAMLVGQAVGILTNMEEARYTCERARLFDVSLVSALAMMLAFASVYQIDLSPNFGYRGHVRWSGPWDNPNISGLLMGTGFLLAVTLGIRSWTLGDGELKASPRNWELKFGKYFLAILCFVSAVLMVHALLYSYSRGAWIATIFGLAYLIMQKGGGRQELETGSTKIEISFGPSILRAFKWIRRNRLTLSVIIFSVGVLVLWQFRHSERDVIVDRAFSIANKNDFSWRNRITACEGALQIMAENSWFGAGQNWPDLLYQQYYLPPNLVESAAIETNDYLMLGATLGMPALVCFGMYIWLSLTRKSGLETLNVGCWTLDLFQTTCRAGAIVLAVGFWFDGGLFKLATASVFWILLELGRQDLQNRHTEKLAREDREDYKTLPCHSGS